MNSPTCTTCLDSRGGNRSYVDHSRLTTANEFRWGFCEGLKASIKRRNRVRPILYKANYSPLLLTSESGGNAQGSLGRRYWERVAMTNCCKSGAPSGREIRKTAFSKSRVYYRKSLGICLMGVSTWASAWNVVRRRTDWMPL